MKKLVYSLCLVLSIGLVAATNIESSPKDKNSKDSKTVKKVGVIYVKNNKEIDISKKTAQVDAKLEFNNKKTKNYDKFTLVGSYKTKVQLDGKTKVNIDWEKVKIDNTEVKFNEPFSSVLKTKKPIDKNSRFSAKGNLDQLNIALNEAEEKAKEQLLKQGAANSKDGKGTDSKNSNSSQKSASGSGLNTLALGGSNSGYKSSSTNPFGGTSSYDSDSSFEEPEVQIDDTQATCQNEIDGNTIQFKKLVNDTCMAIGSPVPIYETIDGCNPKIDYQTNQVFVGTRKVASLDNNETTVENCTIDYDNPVELKSTYAGCDLVFRKDLKAQVQQEQLFFTWDREDQKIGTCTDSDLVYPVDTYIEYNKECSPVVDYNNMKVKFAYREVAQVGGKVEEVSPCKFDNDTLHELVQTYEGCEVIDDFTNKISTQKERFYYMFENKKVFLGECQESDIVFEHYLTPDTCEFQRLDDNHIVYNKRVAYKDINGIVHYLTQCKPSEDGSVELTTEQCGYEHDFENNQSYPMSKQWFIDYKTNEKIEVSSCSKDPQNFPHQKDHCSWEYDDENFYSTEWVKKYFIDSNTNEKIYMDISGANEEGCVPNNPIPHVQSSESMVLIKSLGFKQLKKTNDGKFYFDNDPSKVIDTNSGVFPTLKGGKKDVSQNRTCRIINQDNYYDFTYATSYNQCVGGTLSTQSLGAVWEWEYPNKCMYNTTPSNSDYKNVNKYTCNYYDYWEEVGEFEIFTKYLRADGTYYDYGSKTVYRIIK